LPPTIDLSAYRIVQEALTNVLKHAGGASAVVCIRCHPDSLWVEVTDDGRPGPSTGGGQGLVGMRERVALYGGEFSAEARPGGGFQVAARFPLHAAPR
jgi:signal transduction histidine kinase